jgi:anti-sigma factor RsiW
MPHLGADVAAYVDGQLSEPAMRAAADHLEECDTCEKAVRQQRLLKSRMSTVMTPEPPAALLASLAGLASVPPQREGWWARLGRSVPFRAGVVLVSASLAVIATAYAVGGTGDRLGDEVAPPYNRYAADFSGRAAERPGEVITAAAMDDLTDFGWACHDVLAGDLHRVSGAYTDQEEVIALKYTDGYSRLNLFEQTGVLDVDQLDGFRPEQMAGSRVWVRDSTPMIVTWDDDGTVFTIVTDLPADRVGQAVSDLPSSTPHERGIGGRVSDGLDRMSAWIGAA